MFITKDIKLLVVHCSDTKDSDNLGDLDLHEIYLKFGWERSQFHWLISIFYH